MCNVRMEVKGSGDGRTCRWEVVAELGSRATEEEGRALHRSVCDRCLTQYTGSERLSYWHYGKKASWGCASREAAGDVLRFAAEAVAALDARIEADLRMVETERLWVGYLNSACNLVDELHSRDQRIADLEALLAGGGGADDEEEEE
jgi:hypothetical protein